MPTLLFQACEIPSLKSRVNVLLMLDFLFPCHANLCRFILFHSTAKEIWKESSMPNVKNNMCSSRELFFLDLPEAIKLPMLLHSLCWRRLQLLIYSFLCSGWTVFMLFSLLFSWHFHRAQNVWNSIMLLT